MISDMRNNKKRYPVVTEFFIRVRKLRISLVLNLILQYQKVL